MRTEHTAPDRFADRTAAGEFLATDLQHLAGDPQALVLGLLRGGLPVAAALAGQLGLPFDALAVRRLVLPERSDVAFAALAAYGEHSSLKYIRGVWESARLRFPGETLDAVEAAARQELAALRDRLIGDPVPPVAGRTVVLVDDGMASGASMLAAVELMREAGAGRVVAAVPVAAKAALRDVEAAVDGFTCALAPKVFHSVGAFYSRFDSVDDDEILALLSRP